MGVIIWGSLTPEDTGISVVGGGREEVEGLFCKPPRSAGCQDVDLMSHNVWQLQLDWEQHWYVRIEDGEWHRLGGSQAFRVHCCKPDWVSMWGLQFSVRHAAFFRKTPLWRKQAPDRFIPELDPSGDHLIVKTGTSELSTQKYHIMLKQACAFVHGSQSCVLISDYCVRSYVIVQAIFPSLLWIPRDEALSFIHLASLQCPAHIMHSCICTQLKNLPGHHVAHSHPHLHHCSQVLRGVEEMAWCFLWVNAVCIAKFTCYLGTCLHLFACGY